MKANRSGYTVPEASRVAGLPAYTLDNWQRRGFIVPSVRPTGEGKRGWQGARLYAFSDLVALRVARALKDAGLSLQALRKIRRELERRGAGLASCRLVLTPGRGRPDVAVIEREQVVSVLDRPGQTAFQFVLDLAPIMREVERGAEEVESARKNTA